MAQTPEQYFENENLHGGYQYDTLKDILDIMVLRTQDDDSILKNTKRTHLLLYAKEGLRELAADTTNDVMMIEFTVPDSNYFTLPQGYVNWVRVSVVCGSLETGFYLEPLDINRKISTATGYLQDHNAEILFDSDGYILESDSTNAYAVPHRSYSFGGGYQPTLDTSKLSRNGEFNIDERGGRITFSSTLTDREVVMEFISDGLLPELHEQSVTIHKHCAQALKDWIYYAAIEQKKNVGQNTKDAALRRYKSSLHLSKKRLSGMNLQYLMRLMREKTKTL
jgi:hypothetical protein